MKLLEKHFDAAFSAPDGIKKLRELILTLAMQGQLVPQNPKDQPASELLRQINAEKRQLVKEGKLRNQKPLPPIDRQETPYALPNGWEWVRLGSAMLKITDGTHHSPPNGEHGEFLYISAKNIKDDGVLLSNATFVSRDVHEEIYSRCDPEYGNVLYIKDGATTGIVTINNLGEPFSMLSSVALLKQPLKINNRYLLFALRSPLFYEAMRSGMTGVAITRVTLDKLNNAIIPLAPYDEQARIVEEIDELMARCDALEKLREEREAKRLAVHTAAVRKLLNVANAEDHNQAREFLNQHFGELYTVKENVTELRKAILQLAVMGKLVPQNPNDSPASELLKQIEAEKKRLVKEGTIRAPKSLPPLSTDEEPFTLPVGWAWARFSHFTTEIATGPFGSMIHQSDYISGGVPLINPSHMIDGRIVYDPEVSIPPGMAKELQSYRLHQDDIVMARRGEMGRCAIVTSGEDGFLCGTGSFILRFVCEIDRGYILNFFRTEYCREHLGGNSVGTTMTNLNQGILEAMPIPVAPAKEQRRIVAKINQMMSLCDALEQQIDSGSEKQSAVLNATMAQLGGQRCA